MMRTTNTNTRLMKPRVQVSNVPPMPDDCTMCAYPVVFLDDNDAPTDSATMFASWTILNQTDTRSYAAASGAKIRDGDNVVVHGGLLTEDEIDDVQTYLGSKPGLQDG